MIRIKPQYSLRFMTDEEYDRYWDELGGTREAIARDLAKDSHALVLDVACGWGYYTFQLASNHPHGIVVAIDIVPSAFTNMRRKSRELRAPDNIEPVMADATRLPMRSAVFGLSTSFLGVRDIYMILGRDGVERAIREMIRTLRKRGHIALAVTPPDLAETEELQIAIEVEGEVFGAKSLPSTFYRDLLKENNIRLLKKSTYGTGLKMTAAQTKTELRDGIEIAKEIYERDVPRFDDVWKRFGPTIERYGCGMYSKITLILGSKD